MAAPATTLDPLEIQNQQLQALQGILSSMGALNHLAVMSSKLDELFQVVAENKTIVEEKRKIAQENRNIVEESQNLVEENKALRRLLTDQSNKIDALNAEVDDLRRELEIAKKPVVVATRAGRTL